MSWNYRLVHRVDHGEDIFAIHEAYYEPGAKEPHSITENPCWPQGETWEEFTRDFATYQAASLYPRSRILEYEQFEKASQDRQMAGKEQGDE